MGSSVGGFAEPLRCASAASLGECNFGGGPLGLAHMSGGGPKTFGLPGSGVPKPLCCASAASLGESNGGGGALGLPRFSCGALHSSWNVKRGAASLGESNGGGGALDFAGMSG